MLLWFVSDHVYECSLQTIIMSHKTLHAWPNSYNGRLSDLTCRPSVTIRSSWVQTLECVELLSSKTQTTPVTRCYSKLYLIIRLTKIEYFLGCSDDLISLCKSSMVSVLLISDNQLHFVYLFGTHCRVLLVLKYHIKLEKVDKVRWWNNSGIFKIC